MTIWKKIVLSGAFLIVMLLSVQALMFESLINDEIKSGLEYRLKKIIDHRLESIDEFLMDIHEDLEVIGSHQALEDYFSSRYFDDTSGMLEAESALEKFFIKVQHSKPKYQETFLATIQKKPVLRIVKGKRVEKFESLIQRIPSIESSETIFNLTLSESGEWIIQSIKPLRYFDQIEGFVCLHVPIDDLIEHAIDKKEQLNLLYLLVAEGRETISKSKNINPAIQKNMLDKEMSGWVINTSQIKRLGLNLILAAEEKSVYLIIDRIRKYEIWYLALALVCSLVILGQVARKITYPIQKLSNWTRQIQKEKLDENNINYPTDVSSNDETGILAGSFQTLIQRIIQQNNSLEELVEKRTFQLKISKEKAEKASLAKSEFLSRMSHELRTPMNAILGFTQLLQMDQSYPLSETQKENLERVTSAGKHLLELINEVLDLSQIESGHLDITLETIDIIPIVDNVISISNSIAVENDVSIEYDVVPDRSYYVEVDKLRFKQVVLNMISNAIKYNYPKGSVVISFEEQKENKLRLGVRDTGHGIPNSKKDKLFTPFERFDDEAEKIEGTGVGLTISKYLVESMGGTIGFESVAGEGSFFYIDLPISDKPSKPVEFDISPGLLHTSNKTNGKKILYIDDILANISLVKQILANRQDIEFLSASNAMDGIEQAKTQIPDLILMDIHMPDINGLTAFNRLHEINETRNIPVIALTADAMDIDVQKALDMGFKGYITKPIDVHKFLSEIDRVLT